MRSSHLFASALLYAAASTAWPSDFHPFGEMQRGVEPQLLGRDSASSTSFDLSFSATEGATSSHSTSTKASGSGKTTGTGKATGSQTSESPKTTSSPVFDPRLPAGGVSMLLPNIMTGPTYYKIGKDFVTFAWNYTSLSVYPSAVDILATCTVNQATYTIALNQTVPTNGTQAVTWDTGAFQADPTNTPLLTETYTLIIYDAAKAISATPAAGYLGTFDQFTFGMYSPQPYTPINDWVCATCSGALTSMEKHTLGFLLGTVVITVLSFSWFAGVAGLW